MFLRSTTSRIGLFASVVTLALAVPAGAAVVEFQVGPLSLAAGQMAQIAVGNPDIFPCQVGVQIFAAPASRVVAGINTATMVRVVNTVSDPEIVPARGALVVGYQDPDEIPGERRLVTARVRCDCRGITATVIRSSIGVTGQIGDPNLATTTVALTAQVR